MVTLKLFRHDDPTHEIERRALVEGELSIGRDSDADWIICDPTKALSRLHCVLAMRDGTLTLRDLSTNGVFLGDGARAPASVPVAIEPGAALSLGDFMLLVEAARQEPASTPMPGPLPVEGEGRQTGALLEAFCAGAGIDPSVFSGDDPVEVMRRLGAVYRQMVAGLSDLTNERTRIKSAHGLERTSVQALDNNPFRWAPAQRVGVDLLRERHDGFLTSEAAVESSFDDLKLHQRAMAAGQTAAIAAVLQALSPDQVAERSKGQSFLKNRQVALWAEYLELHAEMSDPGPGGPVAAALRAAYERALAEEMASGPGTSPPAAGVLKVTE